MAFQIILLLLNVDIPIYPKWSTLYNPHFICKFPFFNNYLSTFDMNCFHLRYHPSQDPLWKHCKLTYHPKKLYVFRVLFLVQSFLHTPKLFTCKDHEVSISQTCCFVFYFLSFWVVKFNTGGTEDATWPFNCKSVNTIHEIRVIVIMLLVWKRTFRWYICEAFFTFKERMFLMRIIYFLWWTDITLKLLKISNRRWI